MCTVLVVDDTKEIRDVIRRVATYHGHRVVEAESESEALQAAEREEPDVIAMDLQLPESTGFRALERMREQGHEGYAIIISAHLNGHTQDFQNWQRLRIFDAVQKPFCLDELIQKLEAAASITKHEQRLCRFLDDIIKRNESSLRAQPVGATEDGTHGE